MDPIAVLQNRIEQLEAKIGLAASGPVPPDSPHGNQGQIPPNQGQQGDGVPGNNMTNVTSNLLHAAETMQNATAGHEKLHQAMNMASELNNYTDPNHMQHMQQTQMHMQEVAAAEPAVRQYCQCMHHCQLERKESGYGDGNTHPGLKLACKCQVIQPDQVTHIDIFKVPNKKAAPVLDSEPIQQVPQMQAQVNQMQRAADETKGHADQVFQGVQELAQNCGAAAQEASERIAEVAQVVEQVEEKKFPKRRNGLD